MSSARRTPLIAAMPKMLFPFLVILPGIVAIALPTQTPTQVAMLQTQGAQGGQQPEMMSAAPLGSGLIPPKMNADTGQVVRDRNGDVVLDYDLAIPNMLLHYMPTGLLGLGLTALL